MCSHNRITYFTKKGTFEVVNHIKHLYATLKTESLFSLVWPSLHCKPLQGNYRVELVHREIPVVITGNEFAVYDVKKIKFQYDENWCSVNNTY